MTSFDRSLARLRTGAPEADFGDVRRVLEGLGYVQRRQKGSHVTFKKPGEPSVPFPLVAGRKVRRIYVEQFLDKLGLR